MQFIVAISMLHEGCACCQELNVAGFFFGQEAGTEVKHMTDLTGKHQQELCRLVREKYVCFAVLVDVLLVLLY
jgi:hypothetical protein